MKIHLRKLIIQHKGGAGSGHFDHAGRPGEVGGSVPEGVEIIPEKRKMPSREGLARVRFTRTFKKENLENVQTPPKQGAFRSNTAQVKNDGKVMLKYRQWIGFRKPKYDSNGLQGDYNAEIEAYRLAETLGFKNLVPRTERSRNPDTGEKCAAQQWIEGDIETIAHSGTVNVGVDQFSQLAVLDMISGNRDRHGGNLLVDQTSGKIYAIDNNLAFMKLPGWHDTGLEAAERHYRKATKKNDFKVLAKHIAAGERVIRSQRWRKRMESKFKRYNPKILETMDSRWADFKTECRSKGWWTDKDEEDLLKHP